MNATVACDGTGSGAFRKEEDYRRALRDLDGGTFYTRFNSSFTVTVAPWKYDESLSRKVSTTDPVAGPTKTRPGASSGGATAAAAGETNPHVREKALSSPRGSSHSARNRIAGRVGGFDDGFVGGS